MLAFGLAASACGGGVKMLDTRDERLPLEARRWVADAEDGVLVARADVGRSAAARRRPDAGATPRQGTRRAGAAVVGLPQLVAPPVRTPRLITRAGL